MARARLKSTGKSTKRAQPRCIKCGETIEPGQNRYEWTFRYGGTRCQHATHGAPRRSETTQGNVSILYAAQESVEDVLAQDELDFDSWRSSVEGALENAADEADNLQGEYEAAAESFGGAGPNQERAEACESWSETLRDAAGEVGNVEIEEVEELGEDATDDEVDAYDDEVEQARSDAIDNVRSFAEDALYSLEL